MLNVFVFKATESGGNTGCRWVIWSMLVATHAQAKPTISVHPSNIKAIIIFQNAEDTHIYPLTRYTDNLSHFGNGNYASHDTQRNK